jgi:hypothetical protein
MRILLASLVVMLSLSMCGCGQPYQEAARCIGCDGKLICDNGPEKEQLVCPPTVPIRR